MSKKLYDVELEADCWNSVTVTVKADSLEEAKELARQKRDNFRKKIRISTDVKLSDKNFALQLGGIYLLRRYKAKAPARCVESCRRTRWSHRNEMMHKFRYLDSNRLITLYSKAWETPKRVIKKLCRDGKLKPKCEKCVAKFSCFTS